MRIAFLVEVPILQAGGLEAIVRSLIAGVSEQALIYLVSPDNIDKISVCGFQSSIKGFYQIKTNKRDKIFNEKLIEWLIINKIEICHFHLTHTYGWSASNLRNNTIRSVRNKGITIITTNHSATDYFGKDRSKYSFIRNLAALIKRWPGKMIQLSSVRFEICVSKHDIRISCHNFFPYNKKFIQFYHSIINKDNTISNCTRENIILNLGTIAFHKGQDILAEAFIKISHIFPEWSLYLIGRPAEQACVDKIKFLALNSHTEERIHILEPTNKPEDKLKVCSIYVQPSLIEGLGLSLQEAMYYGCACIGSDVGGIPELINEKKNGRIFEAGNTFRLSEYLSELILDKELRDDIGKQAQISIINRDMSAQSMIKYYLELYERCLSN